jgi:hypothetical protein
VDVIHGLIEAAQFLCCRGRTRWQRVNDAMCTQNDEQVTQRGAQIFPIGSNGSGAVAVRQVIIEEPGNRCFVDPTNADPTAMSPLREMRNAADIAGNGVRRIAALDQMLRVRINVRRQWALGEEVDAVGTRMSDVAHGALQEWDRHCT